MASSAFLAFQGCIHGEIDRCYESVKAQVQEINDVKGLIWCGDVQTVRDEADLATVACPPKYRAMHDFHLYHRGTKVAPCLTLFIGGNHEASRLLRRLPFGGWVAKDIYYMGRSAVVHIADKRIAGLSGIYKSVDYRRGYYEREPFNESTLRSIYHVREVDVHKLRNISSVDIFISHDWPTEIVQTEPDKRRLLLLKPFFKQDLREGCLGNPFASELLKTLKPPYWIAAHLHVNFQCQYMHDDGQTTRFLSHDKPKKHVSTSYLDLETGMFYAMPWGKMTQAPAPEINHCKTSATSDSKKRRIASDEATPALSVPTDETPADASLVSTVAAQVEPNGMAVVQSVPPDAALSSDEQQVRNDYGGEGLMIDLEWLMILKKSMKIIHFGMSRQLSDQECFYCNGKGHIARECDKLPWEDVMKVANRIDQMEGTSFVTCLTEVRSGQEYVDREKINLTTYKIKYPPWSSDDTSPEAQTEWWLGVLDEEDMLHKFIPEEDGNGDEEETFAEKSDATATAGNPLLD